MNNALFDEIPEDQRPDVILIKKVSQKNYGDDGKTVASEMTAGITQDLEELELE